MVKNIAKRHKALLKCECGEIVSKGSVFCPRCRADINSKNAKVIKKEEKRYQRSVNGKRK